MTLSIEDLHPDTEHFHAVESINQHAFPEDQRVPLEVFLPLAEQQIMEVKCLCDGDRAVGFYVLIPDEEIRFLSFLAIDPQHRSLGYGSEALRLLKADAKNRPLTLCIEPQDSRAENIQQRVKRKAFYQRNGFHETGDQQQIHGNLYEVLCSSETYSRRAFLALMQAIEESDE